MSDLAVSQINQILAQIRALSTQAGTGPAASGATLGPLGASADAAGLQGASAPDGVSFANLLRRGIDAVNESQRSSDQLASAWEQGAPGVSLAQVMVETEQASVSFQALAQVRNRLISAYQDIMNMPI
jgi:flagellar hook-basal body complex protein FliE